MTRPAQPIQPVILSAPLAAAYLGLSVTTLRTAPDMPPARQITAGRIGYYVRDLDAWAASRPIVGETALDVSEWDDLTGPDCRASSASPSRAGSRCATTGRRAGR